MSLATFQVPLFRSWPTFIVCVIVLHEMPPKWKYNGLFEFIAIEASSGTRPWRGIRAVILSNDALKPIKFKKPFNDYLKNIFVNQTTINLSIFYFF